MKCSFSQIIAVALCCLVASCTKPEHRRVGGDGLIHVVVDAESGTKSSVITIDSIRNFIMEAYVDRDVFKDVTGKSADTRVGNAYIAPHPTYLQENVIYSDEAGASWKLKRWANGAVQDDCYWASSDGNMSFWSRLKSSNGNEITIDSEHSALYLTSPNIDGEKGVKMVFDYSLPTPDSINDATNQEDLVFSYWQDTLVNTTPAAEEPTYPEYQDVHVHFYHALSQIRFCFSNQDGSFQDGLQIKSIAIGDVASGGTCTFWGNKAMDEFVNHGNKEPSTDRDVASIFSWTDLNENRTYRQNYGIAVKSSYSDASEYAGWTEGSYTRDSHTYNLYTCQNVFMMIPQTLSSSACVRLTVFDNSKPDGQKEQEFISYLKPQCGTWEAGKYYTYKLNYQANQISFSATLVAWGTVSGGAREFTID